MCIVNWPRSETFSVNQDTAESVVGLLGQFGKHVPSDGFRYSESAVAVACCSMLRTQAALLLYSNLTFVLHYHIVIAMHYEIQYSLAPVLVFRYSYTRNLRLLRACHRLYEFIAYILHAM